MRKFYSDQTHAVPLIASSIVFNPNLFITDKIVVFFTNESSYTRKPSPISLSYWVFPFFMETLQHNPFLF